MPENVDKVDQQTPDSRTGPGWWGSSRSGLASLAGLTGLTSSSLAGPSCQSLLSFDRLIPRSGEAANRKRPGICF